MPTGFFFNNNSLGCSLPISVMLLKYKLLRQSLNPVNIPAWKQPHGALPHSMVLLSPRKVGMEGAVLSWFPGS